MPLNKQTGNMYEYVDATWNAVKGECPHSCQYCYMRVWKQKPVRLDESELKTDLGEHNFIFVGSSCDMWAEAIPAEWIERTLEHCRKFLDNQYLFQSKNPARFAEFKGKFPPMTLLCITLETNRDELTGRYYPHNISLAPHASERVEAFSKIDWALKSVTIEPVMDFDLDAMLLYINVLKPDFVTIGANSKEKQLGKLPEPSPEKLEKLIAGLQEFTAVEFKKNLSRLRSGVQK